MEADVFQAGNLFHGPQVPAVTLAQGEHGPSGAKGPLPEMGKRVCGSRRVYNQEISLLRPRGYSRERHQGSQDEYSWES